MRGAATRIVRGFPSATKALDWETREGVRHREVEYALVGAQGVVKGRGPTSITSSTSKPISPTGTARSCASRPEATA